MKRIIDNIQYLLSTQSLLDATTYKGFAMQAFIHPDSHAEMPQLPRQRDCEPRMRYVVLLAEDVQDRLRLRSMVDARRPEIHSYDPDNKLGLELKMPLQINDDVLFREVQRVVGYAISKTSELPQPTKVDQVSPATASTTTYTDHPHAKSS